MAYQVLLYSSIGCILLVFILIMLIWFRLKELNHVPISSFLDGLSRLERGLRSEFSESTHVIHSELIKSQENLREVLIRDARETRSEAAISSTRFSDQLQGLIEINDRRMQEIRQILEQRLHTLQNDNTTKLDEIRRTVDEKLHVTLEQRLGESFKLVSERLEAVHKGLGEMQILAAGVGDLKRVLSNVKARGTWGEVQLARLIEDGMTADQYGRNIKPVPGSDAMVEFAIRLPGHASDETPVWLPIDAKFPKEEYERLGEALDNADPEAAKIASNALAKVVEVQARLIANKYVAPPYTTDFAIMFLPTEGLYAEILRCPGLLDRLHGMRISIAGPSNLAALLNSLQMGFRTLTIEQRSSEIWRVLRAVKTEFGKFGESLSSVKKTLETVSSKLGQTEVRSRAMLRNLKTLENLPDDQLLEILGNNNED